jgi:hypothetical protein
MYALVDPEQATATAKAKSAGLETLAAARVSTTISAPAVSLSQCPTVA